MTRTLLGAISALLCIHCASSIARAQTAPPPLFEDFESTNVGSLPPGWIEQNTGFLFFHSDVLVSDSQCAPIPNSPVCKSLLLYAQPLAIQTLWCQAATPVIDTTDGIRIEGWFRTDSTILSSGFDKGYVGLSNTTNGAANHVLLRMRYSPTTSLNFHDVDGAPIVAVPWDTWIPVSIDLDRAQRKILYTIGEATKTVALPANSPLVTQSFTRAVFFQYVGSGYWDNIRIAPHRPLAMRVSAKRIVSSGPPAGGEAWTPACIRDAVEDASRILHREAGVSLVLVDNLDLQDPGTPGTPSSWYCTNGSAANVAELEVAALNDPTAFLWRADAVNVYFVHSLTTNCDQAGTGGTGSLPPSMGNLSHHITLLQPVAANGRACALAHELGHYLGLLHTEENCGGSCGETPSACQHQSSLTLGDRVADTPPDPGSSDSLTTLYGCGCPTFGCDNGLDSHPYNRIRRNLMSGYAKTVDEVLLTEGQRLRLNAMLLKWRRHVLTMPGVGLQPASFCFGDGTTGACPCSNTGAVGHGCDNSAHTGGANLSASGTSSLSNDTIKLTATGLPNSTFCFFYQGNSRMPNGIGVAFGDGIECVGGRPVGLGLPQVVSGTAVVGGNGVISSLGMIPAAGATRHYQVRYRDTTIHCTPSRQNSSNAVTLFWSP